MQNQRAWLREFNALGLQLRPAAAKLVTDFLSKCGSNHPQKQAEALVEHTKDYLRSRQGYVDAFVDVDVIQAVIGVMAAAEKSAQGGDIQGVIAQESIETLGLGDGVQVYNVMTDVKPYDFQRATKEWAISPKAPQLLPSHDAKSKLYADRFHLLLQRLLLEGKFVQAATAAVSGTLPDQRVLTPVESLRGNPGRKITFGLVSLELHDGVRNWIIEDLHKSIMLDLSEIRASDRIITDGSFVLAEGEMVGDVFKVGHLEAPEAVTRKVSLERDQVPRGVFGGSLTDEQLKTMEKHEPENPEQDEDPPYVVFSEVHLDSARVYEKLDEMFRGYEDGGALIPKAYIFMGSFCSSPFMPTAEGVRSYRESFERLKFKMRSLANHVEAGTKFIFVPGPYDPGAQTLPRLPLSDYLTADIAKEIPGVIMATNPCRVRHLNREFIFFRHDVLRLVRRHEVVPFRDPETGGAPSPQLLRTEMMRFLLDQAHLAPLPLVETNVLWDFDHTLRLYPLPDAAFVGGGGQAFNSTYAGCNFCNVGPFHQEASFYCYHPVRAELVPCDLPDRAA